MQYTLGRHGSASLCRDGQKTKCGCNASISVQYFTWWNSTRLKTVRSPRWCCPSSSLMVGRLVKVQCKLACPACFMHVYNNNWYWTSLAILAGVSWMLFPLKEKSVWTLIRCSWILRHNTWGFQLGLRYQGHSSFAGSAALQEEHCDHTHSLTIKPGVTKVFDSCYNGNTH